MFSGRYNYILLLADWFGSMQTIWHTMQFKRCLCCFEFQWFFYQLWPHFGSRWEAFWEPKGVQKSSKILEPILEAKRGPGAHPLGSARRNARGPGGRKKAGKRTILARISGRKTWPRTRAWGKEALGSNLARHPGWGGGALRAFRRAEIIFDVVLFESCVGGVAVAMTVASIFYFEFWFLWGVVLNAFLVAFWRPFWILRVLWSLLGIIWGSFGRLFGLFARGQPDKLRWEK